MNINRQYISDKNTYNKVNAKKYIVVHETDNFEKGADGLRHARAQYNGNLSTSVHFYCGSDGVYQAAELNKCVWAVGKKYKTMPITDASNYNTINIEICVNEDGDYNVARQNAIELVKYLMAELNITADRVIRHYDAKGKYCPRKMMDNPELWTAFKEAISEKKEVVKEEAETKKETVSSEYKGNSIVDYLNSIGEASDFASRKKLAKKYGISNYKGTASQNLQLLNLMRGGALASTTKPTAAPKPTVSYYPAFKDTSIVDGLKSIGVDSSKANRTKIAKANGIINYTGTASQNTKLLSLAKQGKLKKA